MKLDETGFSNR